MIPSDTSNTTELILYMKEQFVDINPVADTDSLEEGVQEMAHYFVSFNTLIMPCIHMIVFWSFGKFSSIFGQINCSKRWSPWTCHLLYNVFQSILRKNGIFVFIVLNVVTKSLVTFVIYLFTGWITTVNVFSVCLRFVLRRVVRDQIEYSLDRILKDSQLNGKAITQWGLWAKLYLVT